MGILDEPLQEQGGTVSAAWTQRTPRRTIGRSKGLFTLAENTWTRPRPFGTLPGYIGSKCCFLRSGLENESVPL
jgi:hypothetical protein